MHRYSESPPHVPQSTLKTTTIFVDHADLLSFGMLRDKSSPWSNCCVVIFECFIVVVVVLLFYVHGKHLRSCRDGQLT